ncbi:hypothetical protein DPMN_113403 [Dreissena polymorpha]|uniref:Uncharacterized protein n=1 Tax=Dreissena polymorpha TaxID=45954 RepID=A0A9D4KHG3_DREPO|nr:hypothetical protein DPMN_113403 [Dreissena polymorpha]
MPNRKDLLVLDTDASDKAISGVLSEIQAEVPMVVCNESYAQTKEKRRFCTARRE